MAENDIGEGDVEDALRVIVRHLRRYHYHRYTGALLRNLSEDEGMDFVARNIGVVAHVQDTPMRPFSLQLDETQREALMGLAHRIGRRNMLRATLAGGAVLLLGGSLGYRNMRAGKMGPEEEALTRFGATMGGVGMTASGMTEASMGKIAGRNETLGLFAARNRPFREFAEDLAEALEPLIRDWVREARRARENGLDSLAR